MISAVYNRWTFDASILSLCVNRNGDWIAAALSDGTVRLLPASDEAIQPKIVRAHDGKSLSLVPDADDHAFLSGGDDGTVVILDPILGETAQIAQTDGCQIDCVAASRNGEYRAYSSGTRIYLLDEEGNPRFDPPQLTPDAPGGLAFSPDGKLLAASHGEGVSLWHTDGASAAPEILEGNGTPLAPLWTFDGRILIGSMHKGALQGWRLIDKKIVRIGDYPKDVRSMAFTARGRFLATSGACQVFCWPLIDGCFASKPPLMLGADDSRFVTCVAADPKDDLVAAGYADGMVILGPLDGRMEIMVNPPQSGAGIKSLVWNADGDCLFASTESGTILQFTAKSVRSALVHAR